MSRATVAVMRRIEFLEAKRRFERIDPEAESWIYLIEMTVHHLRNAIQVAEYLDEALELWIERGEVTKCPMATDGMHYLVQPKDCPYACRVWIGGGALVQLQLERTLRSVQVD